MPVLSFAHFSFVLGCIFVFLMNCYFYKLFSCFFLINATTSGFWMLRANTAQGAMEFRNQHEKLASWIILLAVGFHAQRILVIWLALNLGGGEMGLDTPLFGLSITFLVAAATPLTNGSYVWRDSQEYMSKSCAWAVCLIFSHQTR